MVARLVVVDVELRHGRAVCDGLTSPRYLVVGAIHNLLGADAMMRLLRPDLIVVTCEAPNREMLEFIRLVIADEPKPIVVFTGQSDPDSTRALIRLGVASVVINGLEPKRVEGILEVALERFFAQQAVMNDLMQMKTQLDERKLIERAKGRLMAKKGLSEEQAFGVLRSSAMTTHCKIVDVAREVLQRY